LFSALSKTKAHFSASPTKLLRSLARRY